MSSKRTYGRGARRQRARWTAWELVLLAISVIMIGSPLFAAGYALLLPSVVPAQEAPTQTAAPRLTPNPDGATAVPTATEPIPTSTTAPTVAAPTTAPTVAAPTATRPPCGSGAGYPGPCPTTPGQTAGPTAPPQTAGPTAPPQTAGPTAPPQPTAPPTNELAISVDALSTVGGGISTILSGDTFNYYIRVAHDVAQAVEVKVSDTFPGEVQAQSVLNVVGGACNLNGNALSCTFTPGIGQPASALIQVRAGTLTPGSTVVNTASASVNGGNARASDSNTLRVPGTAPAPTEVPPTAVPPTAVPPTAIPPTEVPPTAVPPTEVPPPPAEEPAPAPRAPRPPANDPDPTATFSPFLPVTVVPTPGAPLPSSTTAPTRETLPPTATTPPATMTGLPVEPPTSITAPIAPRTATPVKAAPTKAPGTAAAPTEKPTPSATTPARQGAARPLATARPAGAAPAAPTKAPAGATTVPVQPTTAPAAPAVAPIQPTATTEPTAPAPTATTEPTTPAPTATTAPTLAPVTTPEAAGVAANSVSIRFNKQSDWGQVTAGETVVYTITLQHAAQAAGGSSPLLPREHAQAQLGALQSSTPITDVLIVDELNDSLEPLAARGVGLDVQRDGQRVQATRARMDAGETAQLVIEARVRADTTLATIQNQASLRYAGLADAINSNVAEVTIAAPAQPTATAAPEVPTAAPTAQPAGVASGEPADLGAALPDTSGGGLPLGGTLLLGLTLMLRSVRTHRARVRI